MVATLMCEENNSFPLPHGDRIMFQSIDIYSILVETCLFAGLTAGFILILNFQLDFIELP